LRALSGEIDCDLAADAAAAACDDGNLALEFTWHL
jgi:hypothetical protein